LLVNPINTHLHILNLDTIIYLCELGDLAKSNLVNHLSAFLSRMPLAEGNLVNHLPAFLSRMPLAEANLVIHFPAILSWMPLVEGNLVNTLGFIYIEHNIYYNYIHQKNFKLYMCK
jgi:hypothetical protein